MRTAKYSGTVMVPVSNTRTQYVPAVTELVLIWPVSAGVSVVELDTAQSVSVGVPVPTPSEVATAGPSGPVMRLASVTMTGPVMTCVNEYELAL
jgi:hypothetical protein